MLNYHKAVVSIRLDLLNAIDFRTTEDISIAQTSKFR